MDWAARSNGGLFGSYQQHGAKENYSRANGMMSLVESAPAVIAPILAGVLLPLISLTGILAIDVVTFFLAIAALLAVYVPNR